MLDGFKTKPRRSRISAVNSTMSVSKFNTGYQNISEAISTNEAVKRQPQTSYSRRLAPYPMVVPASSVTTRVK
ncbi:hypothetical protein O9929_14275 [Vibrio lentus]|nr:hypothetical protein [Vibrio lentus]